MEGKEKIIFDKPFKINGYEVKNTEELRDLFECDVITFEKYDKTLEQIKNGEIGVIKERKHYKKLYEEEKGINYRLRMEYFELAKAINEIENITNDMKVLEFISKLRN